MTSTWNSGLYDAKHGFVSKYGEDVVRLLEPQSGEKILDVGCGTGDLTEMIRRSGALVMGMDSSPEMIAQAKTKYPDIRFELGSAENFHFPEPFDAVFSNATLHWVLEKEKAAACIYGALKPSGRFVAEFGGKGNVEGIIEAVKKVLIEAGYTDRAQKKLWYYPSLSEYTTLLENLGFRVQFAAHFDRPTELKDPQGLKNWLIMFGQSYLNGIPETEKTQILENVENDLRTTHYKNGKWYADYKRLRIAAIKE